MKKNMKDLNTPKDPAQAIYEALLEEVPKHWAGIGSPSGWPRPPWARVEHTGALIPRPDPVSGP